MQASSFWDTSRIHTILSVDTCAVAYTDGGLDSSHVREKREGEEEAAAPSLTDHLFSGQQRGAWGRGA